MHAEHSSPMMIAFKRVSFLLSCVISLAGCAAQRAEFVSNYSPAPGLTMHSFTDNLQNAFFKDEGIKTRFCLQPSPDVALSLSDGLTLNSAISDGIGLTESADAVSLDGRGDSTLITRELMYRACELSVNSNLNPQDSREVYRNFLNAVIQITANVHSSESDYEDEEYTD